MKKSYKYILCTIGLLVLIGVFSGASDKSKENSAVFGTENKVLEQVQVAGLSEVQNTENAANPAEKVQSNLYKVTRVVDGDTIDVSISRKVERIRMIGINTPETVDPRKTVECFGVEASNQSKSLLGGKSVTLEADSSQGERDKYGRLLRYVFLEDGTNFGLKMIKDGYAYEYTYSSSYKYQAEYKNAQKEAEKNKAGLWGNKCNGITEVNTTSVPAIVPVNTTTQASSSNSCIIKGNINSKKEKIYHVPGCGSYNQTAIDETKGERWFCSEQDALDAGWRKALNCN